MGCSNCGSGGCGAHAKKAEGTAVAGCRNNGTCGTSGCNKLNVFDWLSNMELPAFQRFDIVEVRFKGSKKDFFRNQHQLDLTTGDAVVVEMPGGGYHIGYVSLQGELVRLQMMKKKVKDTAEIRPILRIATAKDLHKFAEAQNREMPTLYRTREIIRDLQLEMKLSDVEFQADNTKATFYYSADDRVDFRELIKILASEFRIRVEMRQISLRHEASRLGGIGVCGRELCCSTWLTEFKSVSTTAARYQNLSLNPSKLSGQCGRLKCCLNYELETYLDALVDIPKVEKPLQTVRGEAHLQKTDIFKKIMWFSYDTESTWYPLSAERVKQIIELNKQGIAVESLIEEKTILPTEESVADPVVTEQWVVDSVDEDAFSTKTNSKKKRKKRKSARSAAEKNNEASAHITKQTSSSAEIKPLLTQQQASSEPSSGESVGKPIDKETPPKKQRAAGNKSQRRRRPPKKNSSGKDKKE
ncbi:MAG: regulatory iron-sulfur-containing complex subunit RicT [Cytophagales bacterium]|nr:Signal peptidase-like protein [Bernardetiaceae bacterium]MDW8204528.1 regulatory iron-sulfur-containing complex subunit RicT [Cytophagales bacterium]